MNIPAPRSNHVEVYVNGDYFGLYQNIEHIDDEFVDTWFNNKRGNLYKCSYPANLLFVSNNPDDYKMAPWGTRTYELKTNELLDDYTDLSEFIAFLNQSNDATFGCEFQRHFNVYNYLKVAAVDVLTGNWDGYIHNQNNFYLYHNPLTRRFEYIPYDVDNTWGIDWLGADWGHYNIYNWSQNDRPLYERLMQTQKFRDIFSWHLKSWLDDWYASDDWESMVSNLQDFIQASALSDPYRPLDFDFDEDDFLNALTEAAGGHVNYGIFPFADTRKASALSQLETNAIAPVIWDVRENFSGFPSQLVLDVYIEGPDASGAVLNYAIDGVEQSSTAFSTASNPAQITIVLPETAQSLSYNITVNGTNGQSRSAFCEIRTIHFNVDEPTLVINEAMASNSSTISDDHGDFDDWIEIYNSGTEPINLSGYFLSDNNRSPMKWAFPNVVIGPGNFMLFWADSDIEQGIFHTNFDLSVDGEQIYLFKETDTGLQHLDQIFLSPAPTDYSYGRETDAQLPWVTFSSPTPGASNHSGTVGLDEVPTTTFQPYPNPTSDVLNLDEPRTYSVTDLSGRVVLSGNGRSVDMTGLASGIYILQMDGKQFKIAKEQ
jgi:hypothetical protein